MRRGIKWTRLKKTIDRNECRKIAFNHRKKLYDYSWPECVSLRLSSSVECMRHLSIVAAVRKYRVNEKRDLINRSTAG